MLINGEEHDDLCVGIDLGTTNSVIAYVNKKANGDLVSRVVEIPRTVETFSTLNGPHSSLKRDYTLPSCVYYSQENNYKVIVGDFAKAQYSLRPHLVAKSIKSHMGEAEVDWLSPDVPDKTPAKIAARILRHIIKQGSKILNSDLIKDVVITVPANFDSTMCSATLEAAELAGITTVNKDGSSRPILLSEPNAVIYDLINRINTGEITSTILDLTTPKYVMVFDLGGGTLDITLHKIKWRDTSKTTVKVDEIATNRYTLLGGDDFDEILANDMYERYLQKCKKHNPGLVTKLRKDRSFIMSTLRIYAEALKVDVNNKHDQSDDFDDLWDDSEEDANIINVGGNVGTGYTYVDSYTIDEVERLLTPLLGDGIIYDDYKDIDNIKEKNNIIFPILDVLKKASEKLGVEDITVDKIILNGGMSKFYMIRERLKEFFNLDPIIALNPDLSVACGAAIYHYYLHNNDALKEDMRTFRRESIASRKERSSGRRLIRNVESTNQPKPANIGNGLGIEFGKKILNDTIYLESKNKSIPLIKAGEELPFEAPMKTGLKISADVPKISLPIQKRELDGSYKTIVSGEIKLAKKYPQDMYVAYSLQMDENKVLTLNAWISDDPYNEHVVEKLKTELVIGEGKSADTDKIQTTQNATSQADTNSELNLNPYAKLNTLIQLCVQFGKYKTDPKNRSLTANKLRGVKGEILRCSNGNEFAPAILKHITAKNQNELAIIHMFTISRKFISTWTNEEKNKLASFCMTIVDYALKNPKDIHGDLVMVVIQAVNTLGMCGNKNQLKNLVSLKDSRYFDAMTYAFGLSHTNIDWVYEKFQRELDIANNEGVFGFGNSVRSLGYTLRKDIKNNIAFSHTPQLVKKLYGILINPKFNIQITYGCVSALGLICDQRYSNNPLPKTLLNKVCSILDSYINSSKPSDAIFESYKANCKLAKKMILGEKLDNKDEKYLLEITSAFENQ